MSDEMVVAEEVRNGKRLVRFLRYGEPVRRDVLLKQRVPKHARIREWQDKDVTSMHYLEAEWSVYEMVTLRCHLNGYLVETRRLAEVSGRLKDGIIGAGAQLYLQNEGKAAQFAWLGGIPNGVGEFEDVDGVTILQANWAPPGVALVGCGGQAVRPPAFIGSEKGNTVEVEHG